MKLAYDAFMDDLWILGDGALSSEYNSGLALSLDYSSFFDIIF